VGTGLFLISWSAPPLAAAWTVASAVFAGLTGRDALRDRIHLLASQRRILDARYPPDKLKEESHREETRKSLHIFEEVLGKLGAIAASRPLDLDLLQAVPDLDRLMSLQYESAQQAEEMNRILQLISPDHGPRSQMSAAASDQQQSATSLRRRNVEAVGRAAAEAEAMVDLIGRRLETVLLQVFQMENEAIDLVTAVEAREGSAEPIERLQEIVDARRQAASQLIEALSPSSSTWASS
jgi:hypothetical protein